MLKHHIHKAAVMKTSQEIDFPKHPNHSDGQPASKSHAKSIAQTSSSSKSIISQASGLNGDQKLSYASMASTKSDKPMSTGGNKTTTDNSKRGSMLTWPNNKPTGTVYSRNSSKINTGKNATDTWQHRTQRDLTRKVAAVTEDANRMKSQNKTNFTKTATSSHQGGDRTKINYSRHNGVLTWHKNKSKEAKGMVGAKLPETVPCKTDYDYEWPDSSDESGNHQSEEFSSVWNSHEESDWSLSTASDVGDAAKTNENWLKSEIKLTYNSATSGTAENTSHEISSNTNRKTMTVTSKPHANPTALAASPSKSTISQASGLSGDQKLSYASMVSMKNDKPGSTGDNKTKTDNSMGGGMLIRPDNKPTGTAYSHNNSKINTGKNATDTWQHRTQRDMTSKFVTVSKYANRMKSQNKTNFTRTGTSSHQGGDKTKINYSRHNGVLTWCKNKPKEAKGMVDAKLPETVPCKTDCDYEWPDSSDESGNHQSEECSSVWNSHEESD